jgi:hypothetical protein
VLRARVGAGRSRKQCANAIAQSHRDALDRCFTTGGSINDVGLGFATIPVGAFKNFESPADNCQFVNRQFLDRRVARH